MTSQQYGRANRWRLLSLAIVPPLLAGVVFEVFLGHRHDYTGHFLAGFGASFAATMVWMRTVPADRFVIRATRIAVPLCLLFVAAGGVTEATIFRLAKFDEVDFCNQSLGAVLALLCAIGYIQSPKPNDREFDLGLIAALGFLGAGGVYAVA